MRKLGCVLLLAAFIFAVTGDPVTDAVAQHDNCPICVAIAHQMVPSEAGPVLSCDLIKIADADENTPLPVLCVEHLIHFNRSPPSS